MADAILEIEDLAKHYGGVQALKGVSLQASAGEVLGLVGDNGAGKSTLLKTIAGVQPPSAGTIRVDGVRRSFEKPSDAVEAGISTVYQDLALAMQQDVVANFFLGRELVSQSWPGRLFGWLDRDTMAERTREELTSLRTRIADVSVEAGSLSGGQRQALAIARAAAWCRHVLLLDEPTSALGVEQQREVLDLIRRIRERGVAVVLVSHQMGHVIEVCDRVVVLRLGEVAATLEKDEISEDNLFGYITGARQRTERNGEGVR